MNEDNIVVDNGAGRSLRVVLTELNKSNSDENLSDKVVNVDELLLIQRGPRKKPITWSPVEYDRIKLLGVTQGKYDLHSKDNHYKADINPRLKKRLIMSPENQLSDELGLILAKKLKNLQSFKNSVQVN